MCDLIQVWSDESKASMIVNKNLPVIIQLQKEDDTINGIVFNYREFNIFVKIEDISEDKAFEMKKYLDQMYIHYVRVYEAVNLDDLILECKKKAGIKS